MEKFLATWTWIGANADAIQTICIVLSAVAVFLVIWHNGRISRQGATIEMVRGTFFEDGARDNYNEFKTLLKDIDESGQNLSELAMPTADNDKANGILLRQLNSYELISLGIKKGVFDERFYKRWFFSQLTRDFTKLKPFIDGCRAHYNNSAYFCEFESLAGRWNRKKHPVKHPPKWKVMWWVVSGQPERAQRALSVE